MKNKTYLLNTILAVVVCIALAAMIVIRTFWPAMILPEVSIPNIVLLSLVALVLDYYLARGAKRCYICIPVFTAVTFALLPWAAGYVAAAEIWKVALAGCIAFTACTWLFTSACERLASGPSCRFAPIISALGLYFAAQCLSGIFL